MDFDSIMKLVVGVFLQTLQMEIEQQVHRPYREQ